MAEQEATMDGEAKHPDLVYHERCRAVCERFGWQLHSSGRREGFRCLIGDAYHDVGEAAMVQIQALAAERDAAVKEIRAILKSDPDVVRCCEGGGPEDLLGTLSLTMHKTRNARDDWKQRAEAAEAVVAKLPKYADTGEPIIPGARAWGGFRACVMAGRVAGLSPGCHGTRLTFVPDPGEYDPHDPHIVNGAGGDLMYVSKSVIYSTIEAALAARANAQGEREKGEQG